jgi:hypothetical protein
MPEVRHSLHLGPDERADHEPRAPDPLTAFDESRPDLENA